MTKFQQVGEWIWVLVEERQTGQVNLLGQYDQKKDVQFIPVFSSKEEALQCLPILLKASEARYEAQAMRIDEVSRNAAENGFKLFLVDGQGAIVEEFHQTET